MITPDASFWEAAQAILQAMGVAPTETNLKLVAAWAYCEKPHTAGGAWQWNNPLNTTEPGYGSTQTVNSAGVRVYPSRNQGVRATVATLTNGYYGRLVAALQASDAAAFFAATSEMATWGTPMTCIQSDYGALAAPPAGYWQAGAPPIPAASPPSPMTLVLRLPPPVLGWGLALLGGGLVVGYVAASPARWHRAVAEARRVEREAAQVVAQPL